MMTIDSVAEAWPLVKDIGTGLAFLLSGGAVATIGIKTNWGRAKAETDMLEELTKRCQHLEAKDSEFVRQLISDAKLIGELTAKNRALEELNIELNKEYLRLASSKYISEDMQSILLTRPMPLGER